MTLKRASYEGSSCYGGVVRSAPLKHLVCLFSGSNAVAADEKTVSACSRMLGAKARKTETQQDRGSGVRVTGSSSVAHTT
jgi:hypothetical protein